MAKHKRGGPVVNNGLYRNLHKQVAASGREMKRVREAGYGGLDSAIKGIYKSTLSTQRGFAKNLDKSQQRQMNKILAHTANQRAANRRVTHTVDQAFDAMGGVGGMRGLGGTKALAQQARDNRKIANAGASAAGLIGKTSDQVMGVIQEGTKEAKANARQLAAESFSQRTNEDLALISQQHHDIAMAEIQAQQRMAELEKQHELAVKQMKMQERLSEDALSEASGGQVGLAKQQVNTASAVASELYRRLAAGETPTDVLNDLMDRRLIDQADLDSGVIKHLVRAAQTQQGPGLDTDNMAREVLYALEQMPGWAALKPKQKEKLRAYVKANVDNVTIDQDKKDNGGGGMMDNLADWILKAGATAGGAVGSGGIARLMGVEGPE